MMLGGDEPRIDLETAMLDGEVVETALEIDAAHLERRGSMN
jgi:hypothetical protein